MKISIIIPIYKVEPYLCRCVDSILNQTYTDLEIILVDDGSPDRCPQICDEYAVKDARVSVIHKINGGLSDARNAGLKQATGEWLSFIDSDDWIEPNMFECLLENALKYDAQISVGGVNDELVDNGTVTILKSTFKEKEEIECISSTDAMKKHLHGSWAVWDKIYKREIFDGIFYPVGEINEDEPIMLQLLHRCENVVYTTQVFYHYIHRPQSITTTSFSVKKLVWVKHCRENLEWIQEHYPELESFALDRYCGSLLWALREIALADGICHKEVKSLKAIIWKYSGAFSQLSLNRANKVRLICGKFVPFGIYRLLEKFMVIKHFRKR